MDFERVLKALLTEFERHQIRYAAIGLKIQAIANNPARWTKERFDIEELMLLYGERLDWKRIQEFYELFDLGQEGRQLQERFGHAQ